MKSLGIILITLSPLLIASDGFAKSKKVIYRAHTEVDLSGETVHGAVREPEVFYIFQRKRVEAKRFVLPPGQLDSHRKVTLDALRNSIPK